MNFFIPLCANYSQQFEKFLLLNFKFAIALHLDGKSGVDVIDLGKALVYCDLFPPNRSVLSVNRESCNSVELVNYEAILYESHLSYRDPRIKEALFGRLKLFKTYPAQSLSIRLRGPL